MYGNYAAQPTRLFNRREGMLIRLIKFATNWVVSGSAR